MEQRGGEGSAVRNNSDTSELLDLAFAADATGVGTSTDAARCLEEVLTGRASLVLHATREGRRLIVLRVGRAPSLRPSLTDRERDFVSQRLRGASLKAIATGAGISISTVAKTLQRAMHKLQVRNLAELISVLGGQDLTDYRATCVERPEAQYWVLGHPTNGRAWPASLTRTEREIVAALLAGSSNAEIALTRGVALRTVANQVASIFRKVGVHSRMDLVRLFGT